MNAIQEARSQRLLTQMKHMHVNTPQGKETIFSLIEKREVSSVITYFNIVEKKVGAKYIPVRKDHDWGIKFADGLEVRHIEKKVFTYLKKNPYITVTERRERHP